MIQKHGTKNHDYFKMLRRLLRGAGTRVGHPEDLAELIAIRADLDDAIERAVAGLRRDGFTWQSIGDATGTTRQAAIMKWSQA